MRGGLGGHFRPWSDCLGDPARQSEPGHSQLLRNLAQTDAILRHPAEGPGDIYYIPVRALPVWLLSSRERDD
jgi:hypothetical protein